METMRISLLSFLCFLHIINCMDITKYLNEQAKIVGEKLIRHARNQESVYTVKLNEINNMKLSRNYSRGEIFTFFNSSYALMDQELFEISQSNNHSVIHRFLIHESAIFLKTTEFRSMGFLLFAAKSNVLHIFGFNNQKKEFFKIQNIIHVNITDAVFFKCQDELYLIISDHKSLDLTSVIVYKFVNSHFDETERFPTSGATQIHTFHNNETEIIVVLQKSAVTSSLYEFGQNRIRKIQKLDIQTPEEVLSYSYMKKQYIIVFSGANNVSLYVWTGSNLLFWERFTAKVALTGKKSIFYIDNNPYLLVTNNINLLIFSLMNHQFVLIHNSKFNENWTNIWTSIINQRNVLTALGPTSQNFLEISTKSISIEVNLLEQRVVEGEKLSSCFLNLEKSIYNFRNKLTEAQNNTDRLLREADDDKSSNTISLKKFKLLKTKYFSIKTALQDRKSKKLVINETAEIDLPLGAKKVFAKDVRFEEINNEKWQPDRWLSYSTSQKISGPVEINFVRTKKLKTKKDDPLFEDLLLTKGRQILSGSVAINSLEANGLETKFLNNISVQDFYYRSQPVTIQGLKSYPGLNVDNIKIDNINGMEGTRIVPFLTDPLDLNTNLTIENLWVENINGVNFDKFRDSVFRLGITDTIDGNLAFNSIQAKEMIFDTLSKKSQVLTTSTNQTITSSCNISKILTRNAKTNRINGINFKNSVAHVNGSTINGPVSIKSLKVKNDLELEGDSSDDFLVLNDTHIVGTNESDFLQRYNGNVRIKGNLIVKNFNLRKSAKIFVRDKEFDPKMDQFWTKSTQQQIPVFFEAVNGASAPHIFTSLINNVDVNDYLLNSTEQKKTAKFYFDNVIIKGSVFLDPKGKHSPDLERIQQDSVKINGTFNIKGHKIYSNILKVDSLEVNHLNSKTDEYSSTSGSKNIISNLIIKGDLHFKNLSVEEINNVNLRNLTENSVYIDRPQNITELNFENITAKNAFVSILNGRDINETLLKLERFEKIDKIDNVYINGNVTIRNVNNLSTINNQDVNQLLSKSLSQYKNQTVFGKVKFHDNVKVRDFYVIVINDVDMRELSQRILYKSWNQTISEHFTFTRLKSNNLITDHINDFPVRSIIDISSTDPQEIFISGLKMAKPVEIQSLTGQFECDLNEGLKNIRSPKPQFWNTVCVKGNATFWDKQSSISRVFDKVVTRQSDQVITGRVNFSNHISVNNITVLKTINNINIMEIINDAFLNKPDTPQVITGKKIFVKMEAENLVSSKNTNVSAINDIRVMEINNKIVSKNSMPDVPIKGKKVFFGGLQAKKIQTDYISGVGTDNLVSFENAAKIPSAMFQSVSVVNNLNITFINAMPFEVLLDERFLRSSPKQTLLGNYFFRNVIITEDMLTPQINDVKMKNIVYDGGLQIVTGSKTFTNDVKIIGDVKVELINGFKLSELYEQAVLKNEDTTFAGIVHLLKPTLTDGNIQTNFINNISVDYMLDTNAQNALQVEAQKIYDITRIISDFVHKYLNTTISMPTEILYLEKANLKLEISLPNAISAHFVETKDAVLIHVESEEDGDSCGLPQTCKCPLQQTMQVSLGHPVSVFANKATQRIYSYYDEEIIIHFITHSISSNSYCRTNKTKVINEVSSLSWNVPPQKNAIGGFFIHRAFFNGFITGVEFFTVYGRIYVIIGNYYDPVLDTHNVNTLLLRFNEDKTALVEIQKIPTVGIKTIFSFPTAQGVVLILGSDISDEFNTTNTDILRFNYNKQQFEFLKNVPTFGSLFAEGIVLEMDSFIILADKQSTLLVLKYWPEFDNYYLYQSFQLDFPVSSLSVFYSEGFGVSDAYLSVVTRNSEYFIYSFGFAEGWQLKFSGELDGAKILVPFKLKKKSYLFAPSAKESSFLTIVEHDSN